jgi:hypothetical protein
MAWEYPTRVLVIDELARILRPMCSDDDRHRITASAATWLMAAYTKTNGIMIGKGYAHPEAVHGKGTTRKDIAAPCISILGATVEVGLWSNVGPVALRNGFLGRWLFFNASRTIPRPVKVKKSKPDDEVVAGAKVIRQGRSGHDCGLDTAVAMPKPYEVPIAADAEAWLDDLEVAQVDYQNSLSDDDIGIPLFGRLVEQTHKLALIHAISRNSADPCIDMASVRWAYAVALGSAQLVAERVSGEIYQTAFERDVKRALRAIAGRGGTIPHSQLLKNMGLPTNEFRSVIGHLEETQQIRTEVRGGKTIYHQKHRINGR